jgi:hypothetical protein
VDCYSDGKLVIIGGSIVSGNQDSLASMSQLTVYDTNINKWSIVKTTGTIPSPRSDHSAVISKSYPKIKFRKYKEKTMLILYFFIIASDDKIIILGGK